MEIAYTTVAYWSVHGEPDNLDSFLDKRSPGNFRKVTPQYEQILIDTIEKAPEEYGYEFGRWTAARLATYLEKVTGIKLSSSQISRILHKKNPFTFGLNIVESPNKTQLKEKYLNRSYRSI